MSSAQQIHDLYDSILILDFGSQVSVVRLWGRAWNRETEAGPSF